jgi:hypothetical protein
LKSCSEGSLVENRAVLVEMKLGLQFSIWQFRRFWQSMKGLVYERNSDITVRRLQRAQLLDNQEQKDDHGPSGVQEVLQALPQAYRA